MRRRRLVVQRAQFGEIGAHYKCRLAQGLDCHCYSEIQSAFGFGRYGSHRRQGVFAPLPTIHFHYCRLDGLGTIHYIAG